MKVNINEYLLSVEKPAQYLGNEINSCHKEKWTSNMCLVFPDIYEVGMSNLGIKILYTLMNKVPNFYLERAFMPMDDMEEIMRTNNIPMFSLETKSELKDFDVVGFSLSYEMCYPNMLNALSLAGIPIRREDRGENDPLVMAGGTCVMNPAPLKKFVDFLMVGDGEENMPELARILVETKGKSKAEKLQALSKIEGIYIPSLHDGSQKVKRAIVQDLNKCDLYDEQLIPYMAIVHDRATAEIQRGCTRGCRFCQAGIVYRPVRERSLEKNIELVSKLIENTGHSEISLSSLSSSDYTNIDSLIEAIKSKYSSDSVGVSLPSLRMNTHSVEVAEIISGGKRTGFTFAPEAGSQRMRDIINKGVTEQQIMDTAEAAVKAGWMSLKFYFMIGLPFETMEDVQGIYELVKKVSIMCRKIDKRINITASVSNFVPKPHTPFEWCKQMSMDEMVEKHSFLRELFSGLKGAALKIHPPKKSLLEGLISRGDERTGDLIELAFKKGVKLDDYRDNYNLWMEALSELGMDVNYYLGERDFDATLPWDIIDIGVSKEFLKREYHLAEKQSLSHDCRLGCLGCGMKNRIPQCGSIVDSKKDFCAK
ncbi:TIGR03960 family B12-binding radical SAM protein [Fusobacterium sp.]|uniref:TIGR03960 family B12-binding radical SAM protein n=1 Tax=Fusobacterium sp. TaxID=68766 RepID=UPI00263207B4|nr:TIGR03960 family B12-binding radical SAM protein [Fusobacterium sp.]